MSEDTAPTAELQRLLAFINSHGSDFGPDELSTPAALATWLDDHDLLATDQPLTDGDLNAALAVRERLRAALRAHHDDGGGGDAAGDPAVVPLRLAISADGSASLEPSGTTVERALGELVSPIPSATADGTWDRMKVCPSDTCQWAFYDHSRNRSRRWCTMDVCGNRQKSRTFRERNRSAD